jgi:hypothetical protein
MWASDGGESPVRQPVSSSSGEHLDEDGVAQPAVEDEGPGTETVPAREGATAGEGYEGPGTE